MSPETWKWFKWLLCMLAISPVLFLVVMRLIMRCLERLGQRNAQTHGVKIIHLIYLPWGKDQKLKEDWNDFDHTYEQQLKLKYPDWEIKMWTLPLLKEMATRHYPGVWETAWQRHTKPTQLVDLFRFIVLHRMGGVYVQYGSTLHVHPEQLLPSHEKTVRFFTERVLTPEQCQKAADLYPIRQGVPEESVRVGNQIESVSAPGNPFIEMIWKTILENMSIKPKEDYDYLILGANSLISTLFDQIGKHDPSVELIDERKAKKMFTVSSNGSWRTDSVSKLL